MLPDSIQILIEQSSFDSNLRKRLEEWGNFSSFATFANKNESKILKNLRTKITNEDKRDIGVELYVGFIFSETNCQVIYEPDVSSISRNPDFRITYKNDTFYFEVKRLREYIPAPEHLTIDCETGDRTYMIDNEKVLRKCGDVICEKLGQTVPDAVNIIYIRAYHADVPNIWDIQSSVKSLMECKQADPNSFETKIKGYNLNTLGQFNDCWNQLSAVAISRLKGDPCQIWENPEGLNRLPQHIRSIIEKATAISFRFDDSPFVEFP
jgi:hypothetical protein